MSEEFENEQWYTQQDHGYGFCDICGHPLTNWGACSSGDGDIFDEIGCDHCEEVKDERHASYCNCQSCGGTGNWEDDENMGPSAMISAWYGTIVGMRPWQNLQRLWLGFGRRALRAVMRSATRIKNR